MAEVATPGVAPLEVEYHPITGIPEEYNDFLPKDTAEYKALKGLASTPAAGAEGADGVDGADMDKLSLKEGEEQPKEPAVVIETNKRNKRKTTTIITGLDMFGVKLPEAAKMFKTKFASGCAVTKNAENKEELTCQGDFLDQAVTLILKNYNVDKKVIYKLEAKKRVPYFEDE